MKDTASLDRLHDIVLPDAVPWWPPAPGWYVLFALLMLAALAFSVGAWRRWKANAYRRQALRELAAVSEPSAIVEILRRVALAIAPREAVAELTGAAWPAWLAARCPEPMPARVQSDLAGGVYDPRLAADLESLRKYAAAWVRLHRSPGGEGD